jgi:chemotaxis protein MotB
MISTFRWIGIAALGITLTGCVSQDQYSALKLERDSMAEQLTSAQRDASTANSAAAAYKSQLDARGGADSTTGALMGNLQAQNQTLQAQLEDMNRRYNDAMKNVGSGQSALPAPLTNELNAFAQQNPDLVDFDSARGIVKFKSDVTFNVGDATVTAAARAVIDKFAKILSSGSASGYELLVAGHTDNWYLSSHRAIAVANELMKNGVNSARVGVVGYADQRPAASNSSESGKAQNRRVEVLLLPSTIRPQTRGDTATGPRKDSAKTANSKMNKDGTIAAPGPILNK